MVRFLKVLGVVSGVLMLIIGCASYNSEITPVQWEARKLTDDKNVKVYVKKYNYDSCTGSIVAIVRFCGKGQLEDFIIPALENENITINNTANNSSVIIEPVNVEFGRHSTGFKTTSEFKVNGFNITIVARIYDSTFWHTFTKDDEKNALTVTAKVLTKLIKNNIGGDNEIEVAIDQRDGKLIQYKDNTGL